MELRLDEIKELVLEKLSVRQVKDEHFPFYVKGFNEALTQQGKRKITMNREKLAMEIMNHNSWGKRQNLIIADSILSHLNELIESVAE